MGRKSSRKKKVQYADEFKLRVVNEVRSGTPEQEVATKYRLPIKMVQKWVKLFGSYGDAALNDNSRYKWSELVPQLLGLLIALGVISILEKLMSHVHYMGTVREDIRYIELTTVSLLFVAFVIKEWVKISIKISELFSGSREEKPAPQDRLGFRDILPILTAGVSSVAIYVCALVIIVKYNIT